MWVHFHCLTDTPLPLRVDIRISGLVVEYIVAIDVTRVRFPADAHCSLQAPAFHDQ